MSLLQRFLRRVLELDSWKDLDMLQWIDTDIWWRKEELKSGFLQGAISGQKKIKHDSQRKEKSFKLRGVMVQLEWG